MMPYKKARYRHIRVRSPKQFKKGTFRTQDIGRAGHSMRVAGRLKRGGKWATQKFIIPKSEYKKPSGQRLLQQIKRRYKIKRID